MINEITLAKIHQKNFNNMNHLISFSFVLLMSIQMGLAQWVSINPGAGGQVQDVVADPGNVGTLYLASDMEGVYKTTDNGESWQTTGHLMNNRVYAVAIDPQNSNRVYVGTLYGLHISDDGGETYRFIATTRNRSIGSIAVDPNNSDRIIAGPGWRDDYDFIHTLGEQQNGKGEVFLSEDGGDTWVIYTFDENTQTDRNIWTINYQPNNPSNIYIGSSKGIFKSIDGGKNWSKLPDPVGVNKNRGATISPDGTALYAAYDAPGKLYATPTAAISWQTVMAGTGLQLNNLNYWYPEVDSRSTGSTHKVLVGLQGQRDGLFEGTFNWSGNSLTSWSWNRIWSGDSDYDRGWDYADPNARFAHYTPSNWPRAVWSTTNQTIYEGDFNDNNFTWNNKYCIPNYDIQVEHWGQMWPTYSWRGTASTYTYDIAVHKNYVIQGQGDNGLMESWDYGHSWSNMQHRLNHMNLSDVQAVDIADAWGTPMVVAQATGGYGGFAQDGRLYVKLLENHSPTDKWEILGAGPDKLLGIENGVLRDIAVSPANPAKVFMFSSGHGMYMIEDIGHTYYSMLEGKTINAVKISNGIADAIHSSKKISPHPTNEDVVFLYGSSGSTGVYKGVFADDTWNWTKIYNGSGWDSEVHAWENNGQVYLMYHGFAAGSQGDGNHGVVAMSLDEGDTWEIIFTKEDAKALVTHDWYAEWEDVYTFQTKGGPAAKGNTIVVNYYHHSLQLGYGIFKGTIQADNSIVWEDWTGDLHFPGPTSSVFAENENGSFFYTATAGSGAWMRELGPAPELPPVPDATGQLNAEPLSSKSIEIIWADNSDNETGFRIERKADGQEFKTVGQVGRNKTYFNDVGLQHSTTYTYRVVAFNSGGISDYSPEASATTLEGNGVPCQNPNLIENGDFETNLDGWILYNNAGAEADVSIVDEPGFAGEQTSKISITAVSGNTNDIQFYYPFNGLRENTSYHVSFKGKASEANSINLGVLSNESPWTGYLSQAISLTTEVQDFGPFTFYSNADTDNVRIDFFIGDNIMDIWLDSIVVVSAEECIAYNIDSIKIDNCPTVLNTGDMFSLSYTAYPDDVVNPRLIWTSSDTDVATISTGGTLTALGKGTTTIHLEAVDGGVPDSCIIVVNALAQSLEIDNCPEFNLLPDETIDLNYNIFPEEASDAPVEWTSSNTNVATVDQNGVVTAVGEGSTSIKAEVIDQLVRSRCTIRVDSGTNTIDIEKDNTIIIIPNPVKQNSEFSVYVPFSGLVQIELISITGAILFKETLNTPGNGNIKLSTKELMHKGIYFLRVENEGFTQTRKLILN